MSKPRHGDYHLAEVITLRGDMYKLRGYRAKCAACGWFGPDRETKSAAEDDCVAHDTTENE